jgi:tRNA (cmo5U34)-methyltransferase
MPAPSAPVFDAHAAAYDAMRRRFIPCFDAFYGTALRLIADWTTGEPFRVLDLGAGTGLLSAMILERLPHPPRRLDRDARSGEREVPP